jgi:hypothetical protein
MLCTQAVKQVLLMGSRDFLFTSRYWPHQLQKVVEGHFGSGSSVDQG